MVSNHIWDRLSAYAKAKLLSLYEPDSIVHEDQNLRTDTDINHVGFYIGLEDSSGDQIAREGFMKEPLHNATDTVDIVIKNMFSILQNKNYNKSKIQTSTFHYVLINEASYIPDPLQWDENKDGIFFGKLDRTFVHGVKHMELNLIFCSMDNGYIPKIKKR